jgi:hypothetical protein
MQNLYEGDIYFDGALRAYGVSWFVTFLAARLWQAQLLSEYHEFWL